MTTDTPRTHLFGTPNDSVAPEELLKRNTTTDTPRTDAIISEPCAPHQVIEKWDKIIQNSRQLERELNELWSRFDKQMEAEAEVERLKEQYEAAAEAVARMHEAAVGEIRGPIISVIEDIKAVRERAEKAEAEVERLKKIKPIKLSIKPYSYECGDGCCQEWGEAWLVDGEEVAFGPCEHNRMQQLLSHLGFDASIEGLDEDGEESWSL